MKRIIALVMALIMALSLCPVTALAELIPETYEMTAHYVAEDDGISNDELFATYVQREIYKSLGYEAPGFYRTSVLEEGTAAFEIYNTLKVMLAEVASGDADSAAFPITLTSPVTLTAADLGMEKIFASETDASLTDDVRNKIYDKLDLFLVYDCLLADCPLELYWHDKMQASGGLRTGISYANEGGSFVLYGVLYEFYVATDYSKTGAMKTSVTNTTKTAAVRTALDNAKSIVDAYAEKSDMEKLHGYKNTICSLVSYNTHAADPDNNVNYGNPWQMIYVFDENPATNVVCEGYAKAFQYLCDLTDFNDAIECHTVTGAMNGETHMWNVVTMDDGKNYLVDVTNCDAGTIGADGELFLAYTTTSSDSNRTHTFTIDGQSVVFTYDTSMAGLFCDGYLVLSETVYRHLSATASLTGSTESLSPGDEITLTLRFDGTNIAGIDAALSFDSEVLQLVSAEELVTGGEMNDLKFVMLNENNPINTATDVLKVTLKVKEGATAGTELKVSFKDIVVSNGTNDLDIVDASWSGTVQTEPTITKGDVTLDGEVDANDLTALARHVARIEALTDSQALLNAEVTGDGELTADDLTKLARYVARIIPELGYSTPEIYGAIGDGVNDDTGAFTNAINDSDYVFLTSDLYLFTPVVITGKTRLVVDGNGYTINCKNIERAFQITGSTNVVFRNIIFDGNSCTTQGVLFVDCESVQVENCTFKNMTTTSATDGDTWGLNFRDSKDMRVDFCSFVNIDGSGNSTKVANGIVVHGRTKACENITISNCYFDTILPVNDACGVTFNQTNFYDTPLSGVVENCLFVDCAKRAVKIMAQYVTVKNCDIKDVLSNDLHASLIDIMASHCRVANNTINVNRATYGISCQYVAPTTTITSFDDIIIEDNYISVANEDSTTARDGITVGIVDDTKKYTEVTVKNNVVKGRFRYSFKAMYIANSVIDGNTFDGEVRLGNRSLNDRPCSNNRIVNNTMKGTLEYSVAHSLLAHNEFVGSGGVGVYFATYTNGSPSNLRIVGNNFENLSYGIRATQALDNVIITENVFTNITTYDMQLLGTNYVLADNVPCKGVTGTFEIAN